MANTGEAYSVDNAGYKKGQENQPQQGYPPQQSYPHQQGYQPQQDYPPQQCYQPQQGYAPQQDYPPQQGYPHQQGYAPQQCYPQQCYPQQCYPMQYYHETNIVVAPGTTTVIAQPRPNDYFVFSLLTCLFCFWPTGIAALVFSCSSRVASDRMDYAIGESNGRLAMRFSIVSLVIGLIWIIAAIIFVIGIAVT